jgi:hypothetical protein
VPDIRHDIRQFNNFSSVNALKQNNTRGSAELGRGLKLIERAARHLSFGLENEFPLRLYDPDSATIQ